MLTLTCGLFDPENVGNMMAPSGASGASSSEAQPGPAEPGQPSHNNPGRAGVEQDLHRVLQKLEPTSLQGAKFLRLLERLQLENASEQLLILIREKIIEIEQTRRPRNRHRAISILEEVIRNYHKNE